MLDKTNKEKESSFNQLYSWGFGKYGQLGKKFNNFTVIPNKLDFVIQEDIQSIYTGEAHSIIMTSSPKIYCFGKNIYGQLGLGQQDSVVNNYINYPVLNLSSCQHKIVKVSCGGDHTILLTEENKVITFGLNVFGQLGIGEFLSKKTNTTLLNSNELTDEFSLLKILDKDEYVIDIAAGAQHSCLLTNKNNIYTCGINKFLALGHSYNKPKKYSDNNTNDISNSNKLETNEPQIYNIIDDDCNDINIFTKIEFDFNYKKGIAHLAAGYYHTGCVVDDTTVCIWGCGEVLNFEKPTIFDLPERSTNKNSRICKIKTFQITKDLVLVLNYNHEIFIMGANDKGQLGNGTYTHQYSFKKLFLPIYNNLAKIIQINKMNEEHDNNNNGNNANDDNKAFKEEDYFINYEVKFISIGNEFVIVKIAYNNIDDSLSIDTNKIHDSNQNNINNSSSLNISEKTDVFGWGSNEYGQLSLEDAVIVNTPTILHNLKHIDVFSCGGYHCLGLEMNIPYSMMNSKLEVKGKSSSMTVLNKINTDSVFNNSPLKRIKRLNSVDDFQLLNNDKRIILLNDMKKLLMRLPLSTTVKNDQYFIKEKMHIINELNQETKKLEETFRMNELKILELEKLEKELLDKIEKCSDTKKEGIDKTKSRGITNNFEIRMEELSVLRDKDKFAKGTYGVVFKAKWRKTDVAVKVIKEELLTQEDFLKNFIDEFTFMKNLLHPNILLFIGAGTIGPQYFLVTELCENGNLFELLHSRKNIPLNWNDKRRIALEIAYGMNYLHSFNPPIIHRDLKSMNILLNKFYQVKIADFGTTKFLSSIHMTRQKGTFQWMAPEVILDTTYTEKADVFSFGIILSEILLRTPPFVGIIDKKLIAKELSSNPSYRPQIPRNCPKDWAELMKRCWDFNPNKRPSFKQVIVDLQNARL